MPLFRSTREPTDPLVADLTAALDADRVRRRRSAVTGSA